MKTQEKKKESVLGAIEKYKAEEKVKPVERKKLERNLRNKICRCGILAALIIFYFKIGSIKKKIILLKVLLLCYNRNDMILKWIRLEDNHVETKL